MRQVLLMIAALALATQVLAQDSAPAPPLVCRPVGERQIHCEDDAGARWTGFRDGAGNIVLRGDHSTLSGRMDSLGMVILRDRAALVLVCWRDSSGVLTCR